MDIYFLHHKELPKCVAFGVVPSKRRYFDGTSVIVVGKWYGCDFEEGYVVPIKDARKEWRETKESGFTIMDRGKTEIRKLMTDCWLVEDLMNWGKTGIPLRTDLM